LQRCGGAAGRNGTAYPGICFSYKQLIHSMKKYAASAAKVTILDQDHIGRLASLFSYAPLTGTLGEYCT